MKKLIFFLALGLCLGGGQALYTNLSNLKPTELEVSEYLLNGSSATWLTIKGAALDMSDATLMTRVFGTDALYVPVQIPDVESEGPVTLLVEMEDESSVNLYKGLLDLDEGTEAEIMAYALKHRDFFYQERDVSGLIQFGLESDSDERELLLRENPHLAEDFKILVEGAKPDWSMSLMLVGGITLFILLFFTKTFDSKDQKEVPAESEPPPVVPPPLPPPVEPPPLPPQNNA